MRLMSYIKAEQEAVEYVEEAPLVPLSTARTRIYTKSIQLQNQK